MDATNLMPANATTSGFRLAIPFEVLRRMWESVGVYLVVEMVLPGGSLLALLLYLHRRKKANAAARGPQSSLNEAA